MLFGRGQAQAIYRNVLTRGTGGELDKSRKKEVSGR